MPHGDSRIRLAFNNEARRSVAATHWRASGKGLQPTRAAMQPRRGGLRMLEADLFVDPEILCARPSNQGEHACCRRFWSFLARTKSAWSGGQESECRRRAVLAPSRSRPVSRSERRTPKILPLSAAVGQARAGRLWRLADHARFEPRLRRCPHKPKRFKYIELGTETLMAPGSGENRPFREIFETSFRSPSPERTLQTRGKLGIFQAVSRAENGSPLGWWRRIGNRE